MPDKVRHLIAAMIVALALTGPVPRSRAADEPASRPATKTKTTSKPAPPADTLDACKKLYMSGKYAAAAKGYEHLKSRESAAVSAAIGLARAQAMQGQYTKAIDSLESVSAPAADRADWHAAMARALETVGRYTDALRHAQRAHRLKADLADAILLHGRLLETLGKKPEAVTVYKTMDQVVAADAYRKDAPALTALGEIMDRYAILTGQRASEQSQNILHNYFQEAYQKVDQKYWPANVAAGMFLLSKHLPIQATAEFRLAAKANSKIPDVHVGMGIIHLQKWRFEQCMKLVAAALKINPNHQDALLLKSICLLQWRKLDQVEPVLQQVLKTNPNNLEALSVLAALHIRRRQDEKAQPYIDRVRKVNPNFAGLPNTIGQWLAAARQFEQAEKYYRQAIALAPEQSGPLTNLGLLYMQTGDEDKAEEILDRAHKIDDYRSDVVNFLNILSELKKFQVKETEHFIVKVSGKYDAVLLEQVSDYMESIYPEITGDFGHEPARKTIIEIFPLHQQFSIRITGRGWIGTIGACTGRVIVGVAPDKQRGQFGNYNWATVLRHEFTHSVTLSATRNRIPHWFTEACAVWQQPDRRNYKAVNMLVQATRSGRLMPIKELNWGFIRPKKAGDRSLAYAQAEWTMEYIIAAKGYDTIVKMLRGFRDGMTQTEVFKKFLATDEAKFDKGFREWAKKDVKKWGFSSDPVPTVAKATAKVKANPKDAAAHAELAVARYMTKRMSSAEAAAKAALKLDAKNKYALAVLARIQLSRKKYDEAVEIAERLENVDHTSRSAPEVLARCYLVKRKWAKAIAALELLKQRRPLFPYSYEELAKIYRLLGQPEKALPNLIELHRRTLKDPQYARQIAEIYRTADKGDQALEYLDEVTHINPYDPSAYEAKAAIHRSAKRYDKAVAEITNVCLLQGESADAWAKMAMMRYLAGKTAKDKKQLQKAREAAEKALEIDPKSYAPQQIIKLIDKALEQV